MDLDAHFRRLYAILPDYACGLVWITAVSWLTASFVTYTQVLSTFGQIGRLFSPLHLPEIASGFVVAAFGVLLPYVAALVLNPLSAGISAILLRKYYWEHREFEELSDKYFELLAIRREQLTGLPIAARWPNSILHYLQHIQSAVMDVLMRERQAIYIRTRLALPVALIVGLATYSIGGSTICMAVLGIVIGVVTLLATMHASIKAHFRWEESLAIAFLVVTGPVQRGANNHEVDAERNTDRVDQSAP